MCSIDSIQHSLSDSDNNTNSYKLVLACMLILAGVCALVTVVVITGFMYQKSRRRRSYDSSFCGSEYPSDYYLQTETTLSETTDKSPLRYKLVYVDRHKIFTNLLI